MPTFRIVRESAYGFCDGCEWGVSSECVLPDIDFCYLKSLTPELYLLETYLKRGLGYEAI
jgi:hypothetical protein